MRVAFQGKTLSDVPMHPSHSPGWFWFDEKRFEMGGKKIPFGAEETYVIKMHLDLDRREWSGSINGEEILPTTPFPPQMSTENNPNLLLTGISFGSSAGAGDRPGGRYAISRLTLKKLAE
jgi:hypothetical protein